jgi:hypothetical protein
MRWEDERYIRVFTRDTPPWDALGWEAQALLVLIFRKMDRTGVLALGGSGRRGLAACVRMPLDVVERSLDILLEDGVLAMRGPDLFCKNFMSAQDCAKSDALRSREKRERAHLELTQNVSLAPQIVGQTSRSDTNAPRSDTPSVPSVPAVPSVPKEDPPLPPVGGKRARKGCASEAFEKFYQAYPRHTARASAEKAWPGDEYLPAILSALEWQAPEFRTREFDKVPHPATWLNGKRWTDEKPTQLALGPKPFRPTAERPHPMSGKTAEEVYGKLG